MMQMKMQMQSVRMQMGGGGCTSAPALLWLVLVGAAGPMPDLSGSVVGAEAPPLSQHPQAAS